MRQMILKIKSDANKMKSSIGASSRVNASNAISKDDEKMKYSSQFPLTKMNFVLMAVSGLLIIVGFLLMLGGANDGETFNNDIFSTRRIVVGPTMAFLGFVAMAVSIIYKPNRK